MTAFRRFLHRMDAADRGLGHGTIRGIPTWRIAATIDLIAMVAIVLEAAR